MENSRGGNLKKSTQNYHIIALRSFLKYLAKRDIPCLAPEKIELSNVPQRQVEFLEGKDLERLLAAPNVVLTETLNHHRPNVEQELLASRDSAILELFFSTGLRISELCNLQKEDINLANDEFTIRGKGEKLRVVFLSDRAKQKLRSYLSKRQDLSPYLFVSLDRASLARDETPLTPRSVQRLIRRYSRVAGITKHVTPHTLRHSFATDLLRSGANIREVQQMLGHASITTTQVYTHVTDAALRDVHKKFHGGSLK
ncbi:MAG: tyrosine-type recombinase/integrase [Candidatus Kerfeldbacteria bacterium]|nr:tyrosine-type recombinase/integrase [Candidatus Kerfeldbacteria bacterium]